MVAITTDTSPRSAARQRPELRLVEGGRSVRRVAARYRRRRLGALVLLAVTLALGANAVEAVSGAFATDGAGWSATADATGPASGTVVVVQPGDTLWSLAAEIAPDRDPRPVVDELIRSNPQLEGSASLAAGTRLVVP